MNKMRNLLCVLIGNTCFANFTGQAIHQYTWANYYQFAGDYKKAACWYDKIFVSNAPAHVYKGYLIFLFETNAYQEIIRRLPQLEKKFEKDPDIQFIFAQSLAKVGKEKEAEEKILKLADTFKTHPEIIFQAVHIYVQRKELEKSVASIDIFLNNSPRRSSNFIFYFMKSQLCLQQGNYQEALIQVRNCLDIQPGFGKGWLMLALLEEQQGHLDKAIKGYMSFLEIEQANVHIQQHLIELAFRQSMIERKTEMLIKNKSNFDKALYFLNAKEYNKAIGYIDQALAESDNEQARFLKINILSSMGNHVQAAEVLKGWLLKDATQEVWLKSLHLLCRTGLSCQKTVSILEDINKHHPKEILPLLYLIDISLRMSNPQTVVRYYKKALELVEDADLKTRLYFHMAQFYYKQTQYKEMHEALEKGYSLGTDFPPLLNMLAYYYTTRAKDLNRAQLLMNKLFAKNKINPHFLDTQALIYYKSQRYDKAIAILEPVAKKIPDNFDVLKHLSKTYFKLGQKDKAISTLEKARLLAESDNEKQKCTSILGCWSNGSQS